MNTESRVGDTDGAGRFIVFQSKGNESTVSGNRNNADGNYEIFLFDAAQRHIFQITNTKRLLKNVNSSTTAADNIKVDIINTTPKLSNDGKWLIFSSNATYAFPGTPWHFGSPAPPPIISSTNPGNFDANSFTDAGGNNNLVNDGNTEIWLYRIPDVATADLSSGDVPAFVDLSAGIFTRVTNTTPSRLPVAGATVNGVDYAPIIAEDNRDPSIDDGGFTTAFISTRDLVPPGNSYPSADNPEVFVFKRTTSSTTTAVEGFFAQVTQTPRGNILLPLWQANPTISGNGLHVAFVSNAGRPLPNWTDGCNNDFNEEIFLFELDESGNPTGPKRQVTNTTEVDPAGVNLLHRGTRALSRDGRYIVFNSRARLDGDGGINAGYGTFVFDAQVNVPNVCSNAIAGQFSRVGPIGDADAALESAELVRFPQFSDYAPETLSPGTLIFTSRMNFRPDGTVPSPGSNEGLNPASARPIQVYSYPLSGTNRIFKRLTRSASIDWAKGAAGFPSNSASRIAVTLVSSNSSMIGGYYLLTPPATQTDTEAQPSYFTGASGMPISETLPEAQGFAPNMLGSLVFSSSLIPPVSGAATQVSNSRSFVAPIQLRGVSVTIDGIAANLTSVVNGRINFIVPPELTAGNKPIVINHNGVIVQSTIPIIQSPRPDILTTATGSVPAPGGRAKILNVTNPDNPTPEPFTATTETPNGAMPTRLRVYLTGVQNVTASQVGIQIGNMTIPSILTDAVITDYPGVFTVDFTLPSQLAGAGDAPIIVTVGGVQSRTVSPPRLNIVSAILPYDLAVWRKSNGTWYVLNGATQTQVHQQWGNENDIPVLGDFDHDGKNDFAVYRPDNPNTSVDECANSCIWYVLKSSDGNWLTFNFGVTTDKPVPADYDNDGYTDVAVFRPLINTWYINRSSDNQLFSVKLGAFNDTHVPSDYDGDGKADAAVWKVSSGTWNIYQSTNSSPTTEIWGAPGDKPVPGDYDGDGKTDLAVWRPDNVWQIKLSGNGQTELINWGINSSDIAVQGDYDSDGRTDIAVWRPSTGYWYIKQSRFNGQMLAVQYGQQGDIPVPAPYRRP